MKFLTLKVAEFCKKGVQWAKELCAKKKAEPTPPASKPTARRQASLPSYSTDHRALEEQRAKEAAAVKGPRAL